MKAVLGHFSYVAEGWLGLNLKSDPPQHEKSETFYYFFFTVLVVQCSLRPRWEITLHCSWSSHIFFPVVMYGIHVRNQVFWKLNLGSEFCFDKCGLTIALSHLLLFQLYTVWAFCSHRKFN
jgi:hypothetical protein